MQPTIYLPQLFMIDGFIGAGGFVQALLVTVSRCRFLSASRKASEGLENADTPDPANVRMPD
jgi:hypothetical protein